MARIRLFDLSTLSRQEIVADVVITLLFLVFQITVVGLLPAHLVMVGLFNLLFFAHPVTRQLAVFMIPFILFEISYDWMRLYPNYKVNPIDIEGIFNAEKDLFGISMNGQTVIPGEYFMQHNNAVADFLAGVFYLCWVPMPIFIGVWLFFKGERHYCLRFALAFLFVNLIGFVGYYVHPAAPPWYALEHGFTPDFNTPGDVAGLIRFDEMIGMPIFQGIYVNNSNIFAAVPSLHSAYMLIATVYAVLSKRSWQLVTLCTVVTVGIWWTAVYSCHHYIIDVLLGILTAIVGIAIFEKLLMRWKPFLRFFNAYYHYISK